MDLQKFFAKHFGTQFVLTQHCLCRINERLLAAEMENLDLLLTNVLRGKKLENLPLHFAITDPKMYYSLVCHRETNREGQEIIHIITFVRGPKKLEDLELLAGSIKQEKHQKEIDMLRAYQKQLQMA
jgi:hypothetical protein